MGKRKNMAEQAAFAVAELVELETEPEAAREREVVTILDRLKAPNASDFSRKRKLVVNIGENRRAKGKVANPQYEPKVSAK